MSFGGKEVTFSNSNVAGISVLLFEPDPSSQILSKTEHFTPEHWEVEQIPLQEQDQF